MAPVAQTGIGRCWKGVTNCHRPLTPVTVPPVTGARVEVHAVVRLDDTRSGD